MISTEIIWLAVGVLATLHVVISVWMAVLMRRAGYCPFMWFFISLLLTAVVPYLFLLHKKAGEAPAPATDAEEPLSAKEAQPSVPPSETTTSPKRCPHCGRIITPGEPAALSPIAQCPYCHLPLEDSRT